MRRLLLLLLIVGGLSLIATGFGLWQNEDTTIYAQDEDGDVEAEEAEEPEVIDIDYIGVGECNDCHRDLARDHSGSPHRLTMVEVELDEEESLAAIRGDFEAGEDVRTIRFPGEDEARIVTLEDIAFTLGAGRNIQRYLYEVEEDQYMVLPIQWDSKAATWEPYGAVESWPDETFAFGPNCAYCHVTGLDLEDYTWEDEAVQCETCHGPGDLHAEAADDAGSSPDPEEFAAVQNTINLGLDGAACGQCHSRGTGGDGIHPYPVGYFAGWNDLLEEDVFTIVPPDDEAHYRETGHAEQPNMQFNEWIQTSHPNALESAQNSDNYDESCLTCHSAGYRRNVRQINQTEINMALEFFEDLADEGDVDELEEFPFFPVLRARVENYFVDDPMDYPAYEDATQQLLQSLEIDPADLDEDDPLLEQIMPEVVEALTGEGAADGLPFTHFMDVLPLELELMIADELADLDDDEVNIFDVLTPVNGAEQYPYGVTCATCHDPHNIDSENGTFLVMESYALCADCHRNPTESEIIHYPVREMFEGIKLIDEVEPVQGSHFVSEDGPDCNTCHMPTLPVTQDKQRVSHFMSPIMPGSELNVDALDDACTGCHTDLVDAEGVIQMITDIQDSVTARIDAAETTMPAGTDAWVQNALDFVKADGSSGIHNYLYADALLDSVEIEIGTATFAHATLPQDITTREIRDQVAVQTDTGEIVLGLTLPLIIMAGVGVLIGLGGLGLIVAGNPLFGVLGILLSLFMVSGAFLLRESAPPVVLTSQNDNCLVCHADSAYAFSFPEGGRISLSVNPAALESSVHGADNELGTFGCRDCHADVEFPHENLPYESLRNYRIDRSQICLDCHLDSTEHYQEVLDRNILVGCTDCHSAHDMGPASELAATLPE